MSSDYRRDFWSAAGDSRSFLDKALFAQDPRLPGVDAQRLLSLDLSNALDVNVADLDRVRAGHRENLVDNGGRSATVAVVANQRVLVFHLAVRPAPGRPDPGAEFQDRLPDRLCLALSRGGPLADFDESFGNTTRVGRPFQVLHAAGGPLPHPLATLGRIEQADTRQRPDMRGRRLRDAVLALAKDLPDDGRSVAERGGHGHVIGPRLPRDVRQVIDRDATPLLRRFGVKGLAVVQPQTLQVHLGEAQTADAIDLPVVQFPETVPGEEAPHR